MVAVRTMFNGERLLSDHVFSAFAEIRTLGIGTPPRSLSATGDMAAHSVGQVRVGWPRFPSDWLPCRRIRERRRGDWERAARKGFMPDPSRSSAGKESSTSPLLLSPTSIAVRKRGEVRSLV
ncbi:unnamed protein product [Linum trigynum]|uniref:Uncharacterized protein n=1 Tax=Linum trigynum TaxID=586398 RepID=A0AAV2FWY6_9ROSI